ncbi:kinase-like protein [Schizopora paradoxa]|uniref:Kinase-like protein n=1 Tax=Schizopora paradoxa TaxID=27342 RepID=A0A0H2RJ55_9AGAM|nr:kinase-like protein [Schizopora paradoxa]
MTALIEKASKKLQTWATMGPVKSLMHQSEIKEEIDSLHRDVDTCAHRFNIATHAGLHRNNNMALLREKDNADLRESLQRVLETVEGLKEIVATPGPGVQNIVQTIQEELQQPIDSLQERETLRQGMLQIYRQTKVLPPGNDLTGQVEKTSDQPVASGGDNDVYTGMWLGQFKVALKLYRALNRTPTARKRFEREVGLWRELQHPNICRLYGIVRLKDVIYSVSSWMENGDALSYINSTEQIIDRMGLLMDVQSGMEYLHTRNIVHGDLRAVNILIDDRGRACISDFGLSKVLEDVDRGSITSHHTEGAVRWHARELVAGDNDESSPISPETDVWSFGMLCLEIMTGERPYAHRRRDAEVIADLLSKRLPPRPVEQAVQTRGLTDDLWNMMLSCWSLDPRNRPRMKLIRVTMQMCMRGMVRPGIQLSKSPQPILAPLLSPTEPPTLHHIPPTRSATVEVKDQEEDILSFYDRIDFGDPSDLDTRLGLNAPGWDNRRLQSAPAEVSGFDQSEGENSCSSISSSLPSSVNSPMLRTRTPSFSSSVPIGPSPLLDFHGLDTKVVVRRNLEGRLLRATLAGLVEELLAHSQGYAEHDEFQDIFLTSYYLFNPKPEPLRDVIRLLLLRQTRAENDPSVLVEERVAIRHDIFSFLRKMLVERHGNAIDIPVLEDLRIFLESVTSPSSFVALAKDLSASIEALVRERKQTQLRSSTIASLGTRSIRQSEIEPDKLAFAMMLLEGNIYKRITPTDCVLYLMDQDSPTSIFHARILNNKIVNWVKRAILLPDQTSDRADTLRFFINTAFECRKLRNFSSMSAILAATNSPAISRLKKTVECLEGEPIVLETQTKLSAILNPNNNHHAYKELLPSVKHHCVPWLAVHLKDMKTFLQEHDREFMEGGQRLINFELYRALSEKISEILQYQGKHRDLDSAIVNFEPLTYLEGEVANTSLDADAEAALEARSEELLTLENS